LIQLPQYKRASDGKIIASLLSDEEIRRRFA